MLRFPIPVLLLFVFAWTAAQAGEQRWYVDSSAAPGGDGSASAPYASLASVASRTEPGLIVLRSSRTHYQGPVRLHPGQSLRGEGAERPVVTSSSDVVTVEGGDGEVVVSDVVILGTGTAAGMTIAPTDAAVTVRDVRIETAGGTALSASGVRRLKIQRAAIVTSNAPTAVEIHDSELDAEIQSVSARGNTLRSAIVLDDISGRVVIEGGTVEGGTASAVSASNVANLTLRRMVLKGNARTNGAEASACGGDGDDLAVSCHAAIALRNVAGAILENVSIEDSGQAGIVASGVRGLKISDTMIAGSGDELFEHAMIVAGGSGDYVLDNVRITRSASRHLMIRGGEDLRFKISGSSFSETAPPHGQQAILLHAGDADSVELAVRDSVFTDTFSNAIDVIGSGDARIGVTVEGNQFHRQAAAVNIAATERATIEYVVAQNPAIHGSSGTGINVYMGTPSTGRLTGTIDGNTIGESGVQRSGAGCNSCSGVTVTAAGHGVVSADITTNVIQQTGGSAIVATAGPGGPRLRLSLRSNLLRQPAGTSAPAIRVGSAVTATDTSDVCLTIGGTGAHANTIEGSWGEHGAIQLLHRFGAARFLIDSLSGGNDEAAVAAFVAQVNRGTTVRAFLRPDSRERGFEPSAGCPVTASP